MLSLLKTNKTNVLYKIALAAYIVLFFLVLIMR